MMHYYFSNLYKRMRSTGLSMLHWFRLIAVNFSYCGLFPFCNVHADRLESIRWYLCHAEVWIWCNSSPEVPLTVRISVLVRYQRWLTTFRRICWDCEFCWSLNGWGGWLVGVEELGPLLTRDDLVQQAERAQAEVKVPGRSGTRQEILSNLCSTLNDLNLRNRNYNQLNHTKAKLKSVMLQFYA